MNIWKHSPKFIDILSLIFLILSSNERFPIPSAGEESPGILLDPNLNYS
jgi:hypothetical protein